MKTNLTMFLGALLALMLVPSVVSADETPIHAYIEVNGLACPFCVQGLEKHLKRIPGVSGVTTSLQKGEAVAHIDGPETVTEQQLRDAVRKAGFTAGRIRFEKGGPDQPREAAPDDDAP